VFDRADAAAAGIPRGAAERRLASGRWVRLRRGQFCTATDWKGAGPERRLRLRTLAAARAYGDEVLVSHLSAAELWGLPLPPHVAGPAVLTRPKGPPASTRYVDDLVVQVAPVGAHEWTTHQGLRVTRPARTVADCLRHLPAGHALPIADAAVHRGLTTRREVEETVAGQSTWPYAGQAVHLVELIDGRRETWLESHSVAVLAAQGVPLPRSQAVVEDDEGRFVGRVDFLWPDHSVIGEADGWGKYALPSARSGDLAGPDAAGGTVDLAAVRSAIMAEKAREDRLRELGYLVVRWSLADVDHHPHQVARRIRAAMARRTRWGAWSVAGMVSYPDPSRP
jgi:hypothetical protein